MKAIRIMVRPLYWAVHIAYIMSERLSDAVFRVRRKLYDFTFKDEMPF